MAHVGSSDQVLGHYVLQGSEWVPALAQSSELFKAVVSDSASQVESHLAKQAPESLNSFYNFLYWCQPVSGEAAAQDEDTGKDQGPAQQKPQVQVKPRTLAMIAAYHGSMRVLSYLLSQGADPRLRTPDGLSCYEFAEGDATTNAPTIRAMLDDAAGGGVVASGGEHGASSPASHASHKVEAGQGEGVVGASQASPSPGRAASGSLQDVQADLDTADGQPYSTRELTRAEYSTDTFRMYCFKVLHCSKRYAHDWRACPFAHPTENARRRDPREFTYCSIACPDYKQGFCIRGDTCQYAHGVFECWLHPSRYRTQLCKDGSQCNRPVCFFAHSLEELRTPTHAFMPSPEERLRVPQELLAAAGVGFPPMQPPAAGPDIAPVHQDIGYPPDSFSGDQNVDVTLVAQQAAAAAAAGTDMSGGELVGLNLLGATSPHGEQGPLASPSKPLLGGYASSSAGSVHSAPAVTVPRMSNAFARKHGIDPRSNPLLNLRTIALQQQSDPQQGGGYRQKGRKGARRHNQQQQQHHHHPQHMPPQHYQAAAALQQPYMQPLAALPGGLPHGVGMAPQVYGQTAMVPVQDPQTLALLFSGMSMGPPTLQPGLQAMPGAHMQLGGMPGVAGLGPGQQPDVSGLGPGPQGHY